jgi:ribosomal protein S18 acetylase RimI-like enzyme
MRGAAAMDIRALTAAQTTDHAEALGKLLCDAVNGGASVGFIPPLDRETAWAHWIEVSRRIAAGGVHLLVAEQGNEMVGAVQVIEAPLPDARHRAEITQWMVRALYRQRGYGRRLLTQAQVLAQSRGRNTLTMYTLAGDRSERLLLACGWTLCGEVVDHARGAEGRRLTGHLFQLQMA